jgi:hypothetical protein
VLFTSEVSEASCPNRPRRRRPRPFSRLLTSEPLHNFPLHSTHQPIEDDDEKDFRRAKRGACPVCYDGVVVGVPLGCGEEDPEGEAEGDDDGVGDGLEDGEGFDNISSHVQSSPL